MPHAAQWDTYEVINLFAASELDEARLNILNEEFLQRERRWNRKT